LRKRSKPVAPLGKPREKQKVGTVQKKTTKRAIHQKKGKKLSNDEKDGVKQVVHAKMINGKTNANQNKRKKKIITKVELGYKQKHQ